MRKTVFFLHEENIPLDRRKEKLFLKLKMLVPH